MDLCDLLLIRHVLQDLRVVLHESNDLLDGQCLILRDRKMSDVFGLDVLLLAADEVFKEAGEGVGMVKVDTY